MNRIFKVLQGCFCILLCVGLILSTAACKKQNNESALSDEYEIVYEYIEEPSDNDDSSETATESNQVNSN